MATVQNLTIKQQSGASGTYYASWMFKATTTSSTTSNSTSSSNGVKTGDLVSIKSGATYYNGVAIPSWVMAKRWYVAQVSGDRAVLGRSEDGANNIQSAISTKYLTGGTGSSSGSSSSGTSTSASELDHYEVKWYYDTGDSVWFSGGESTTTAENAIYNAPSNAVRIKVTVKPVSKTYEVNGKETHYWNGVAQTATYSVNSDSPETIGTPSVSIDGFTLTATLNNVANGTTDYVEFQVWDGSTLYNTSPKVQVRGGQAVYTCTVAAGGSYRVRARAVNLVVTNTGTTINGGQVSGVSYKYGPWSDFSGGGDGGGGLGTIPTAPGGIRAVAESENSIKVTWSPVSDASSYEVQYTTNRAYFDSSSDVKTMTVTSTTAYLTGLDGDEWFIRVRAKNSVGDSGWSSVVSAICGSVPEAPTTWSLSSSVIVGEDITLYWVHNTEDGSKMKSAQIQLDIGGTIETIDVAGDTTEDDDDDVPICQYIISTDEYAQGTTILWKVRTQGITGEYGPWSTQRTIKVYAPPTLGLSVSLNDEGVLTALPITINATAGPNTQVPISYHVTMVAETSYETNDFMGEMTVVPAGSEIYSKIFNSSEYEFTTVISAGDVLIENDQNYTLTVLVSMDSGLTATSSISFPVTWDEYSFYPDASITIDKENLAAYINPLCMNQDGTLVDNVLLAVYRREFNGTFTKLMDGLSNDRVTTITDAHPALDYARYRIVAQELTTGAVFYSDLPGIPVGEPAIVIQWNDKWDNFNYTNITDRFETQPWAGSMLRLPYNVDVSEGTDPDVSLIEYIGRKNPVSYYGTQRGQTATWNTEFPKRDKDTLYALRRLSDWDGDVYVREPNGVGYWAHIKLKWNINHLKVVIPVTIEVTRVEGDA